MPRCRSWQRSSPPTDSRRRHASGLAKTRIVRLWRHVKRRRDASATDESGERRNGRIGIYGELDPVAGNPVLSAYQEEMDRLYRDDGGRDADAAAQRTFAQRGADALVNLIDRPMAAPTSTTSRPKRPHPRYMSHLRVDPGRCTSENPTGPAAFLDGTPLPQSTLELIACESAFVGAVYGTDGSVLWQGRSVRLATDDQWQALIDRDGGCRHCGADPSRCQAHHITPWAPPARGPTDIDHLVLTCDQGHHLIHECGYRVVVDEHGHFSIVPP